MVRLIGLDFLPQDALIITLILMVVVAVIAGWISDAVMADVGYGVIGNAVLTLVGAFVGLAAWTHGVGPVRPAYIGWIAVSTGGGSLAFLLLFALFKRAVM